VFGKLIGGTVGTVGWVSRKPPVYSLGGSKSLDVRLWLEVG